MNITDVHIIDIFQVMTFACLVVYMFIQIVMLKDKDNRSLLSVPDMAWVVHGLIFYLTRFITIWFHVSTTGFFTTWSSILRWHGYVTLVCYAGYRYVKWRRKKS